MAHPFFRPIAWARLLRRKVCALLVSFGTLCRPMPFPDVTHVSLFFWAHLLLHVVCALAAPRGVCPLFTDCGPYVDPCLPMCHFFLRAHLLLHEVCALAFQAAAPLCTFECAHLPAGACDSRPLE